MGGGEYPRAMKKKLTGERYGDTFSVFGRRERWRRESLAGAEGSHGDVLERKGGVACTCPSHVPLLTWCQGKVVVPVWRR